MEALLDYPVPQVKSVAPIPRGQGRVLDCIGETPLLDLSGFFEKQTSVRIFGKAEWFNPGGSVKDRAALYMILEGERSGRLTSGKTILDATSGNTGIAYAMIGAALGYRVKLVIPENAGSSFRRILRAYGAELVFSDAQHGSDGAIRKALRVFEEAPSRYFYPDQYNNPANWLAHYKTTGEEIIRQTDGQVTHFIAGLGTSGTFIGTGRRLKEYNDEIS